MKTITVCPFLSCLSYSAYWFWDPPTLLHLSKMYPLILMKVLHLMAVVCFFFNLLILELAQTHAYWVNDDIHPSHSLFPPFPLTLNLCQHQGLFQWLDSLHRWLKYWSFSFSISPPNEYSFRTDWFDLSKGLSRVFSNTAVQKHQFFGPRLSLFSNSHTHTWLLEKP